jgi:hypothetical protein
MAATSHPLATKSATDLLSAGGNAYSGSTSLGNITKAANIYPNCVVAA